MSEITGGCRASFRVWLVERARNEECYWGLSKESGTANAIGYPCIRYQILRIFFSYVRTLRSEAHIASFHTPSHDTTIVSGHPFAVDDFALPKPRYIR